MATIFLKETGSNGDGFNCVVLEPREALLYPFDFGTGWKSVSAAVLFSFCGLSGNNSIPAYELVTYNASNYSKVFIGFTSYENPFPFSTNNVYFGYDDHLNFPSVLGNSQLGLASCSVVASSGNRKDTMANIGTHFSIGTMSGYTGQFDYMNSIKFKMSIDPVSYASTGYLDTHNNPRYHTINSKTVMEEVLNTAFPNSSNTDYFTHNNTATGYRYPRPNAFIIYSPFVNNKMRIHGLLIRQDS
jgi:hypothetical protein